MNWNKDLITANNSVKNPTFYDHTTPLTHVIMENTKKLAKNAFLNEQLKILQPGNC